MIPMKLAVRPGPLPIALAAVFAAAAAGRAAEPSWTEVKSPHFTVVTNAGEKEGRKIAWKFEQMRAALKQLWPWARVESGRPFVVLGARDEPTLRSLAPEYWERKGYRPSAVSVSGPDRHYAALRTDLREPDDVGSNPHFEPYRAYVQVLLRASFPGNLPLWFNRGLAELYGNTVVRDKEIHVGRPIRWHIETLRREARQRLAALLVVDRRSPQATEEVAAQVFSAQSWAFVHYLMFGDREAHGAKLNRFAELLRDGRSGADAFRETLGEPAAYEMGLATHIDRQVFSYHRVAIALDLPEATFAARTLTPAASAATRAGMHVTMGRPVEARALAEEAKKADPSLPEPWEVDGLLADREGRRDDARTAYGKAVELGSRSFYAHYRLAQLLWTPGADRAVQERIAAALETSVGLNPEYANAHSFLAETKSRLGAAEPALGLARRAVALEPGESYHHLALARVLWDMKQPEDARREAETALRLADSERDRDRAQQLIDFFGRTPGSAASPVAAGTPPAASQGAGPADACVRQRQAEACARLAPQLEQACNGNKLRDCALLAWLYDSGLGVEPDAARAMALYDKACRGGDRAGCIELALVHVRRQTPGDLARARELLQPVCDAGEARACSMLGSLPK